MIIKKIFIYFIICLTFFSGLFMPFVAAANYGNVNIISDNVMNNTGSMSASQIQSFLNGFSGNCLGGSFLTPNPLGYSSGAYQYGGNVNGGAAIYNISARYNLNPQVLIATLEKEQGLISRNGNCDYNSPASAPATYNGSAVSCGSGTTYTDCSFACQNTPTGGCVAVATGYACPGFCKKSFNGFSKQISGAAWVFRFAQARAYGQLTGYSGYDSGDESISYSGPMTAGYRQRVAGGSSVYYDGSYTDTDGNTMYIANGATASMLNYTPFYARSYTPDKLFRSSFTKWFGNLYGAYSWSTTGYLIYDSNKTNRIDPGFLNPGEIYTAVLQAKNTGDTTWYNNGYNPIILGTTNPDNSISSICYSSWYSCNRPALLKETSVAPGENGSFEFQFRAPYTPGEYRQDFKPLAEMLAWTNNTYGQTFGIRVVSPGSYKWSTSGYTIYNTEKSSVQDPGKLNPGQEYIAIISARNTGTATWRNSGATPVTLATSSPTTRTSNLCNNTWIACNRPALLKETSVAPGENGSFEFQFRAPYTKGEYRESFKPVAELYSWFNDYYPYDSFGVWVNPGSYAWTTNGYIIKNGLGQQVDPGKLSKNTTYTVSITARNTGTATWRNSGATPVTLATSSPTTRTSNLCNNTWIACNRPAYLNESTVAPGETGTFSFNFTTPGTPGEYRESFKPVAELYSWFNDYYPYDSFGVWVVQ